MSAALQHILYVEDEPDIQAVARIALENVGGFQLTLCSSGDEALSKATGVQPDLVLLDVMMPGMDGPSTMARLRELPYYQNLPMVFMTAKVQPQEVAHFKSLGAIAVIAKPFNPMTLADEIRSVWNEYQSS